MRALITVVCCLAAGLALAQGASTFLITDFEAPDALRKVVGGDSGNVELTIGPRTVTEMNKVLKFVAKGGSYPGIVFNPPHIPKDWSAYEVLAFTVWSPVDTSISLRIDDEKSSNYRTRFNKDGISIQKGRTLVQIPLKDIAKVINPAIIRTMIIFLGDPPPGQTLWFDDILLGPEQTAKVDFIPYEERYDLISSMEFSTPHLPMARGLAGGPLKTFMLTSVSRGREVVEIMQRMDLKVSQLSWDRNWDVNTWGFGDFYGKRGHIGDCALMQKYLDSTLQGPEKFEAMMIYTPWGWNNFSQSAREQLIKRVKEDGEGLVLMMPFTGEQKSSAWPDDLKELSALINSSSDWVTDSGWLKWTNEGRIWSKPWVKAKDHPITNGVPLEALPFQHMETQKYEAAPGAEVLLQLESGEPVMAVKQLGKGRVVTFAVRSLSLTPEFRVPDDFGSRLPHRFWETWYSLANRALLWAAKRECTREGTPAVLDVKGANADPYYTVSQWKNAAGEVTDWELVYNDLDKEIQKIDLQVPEAVKPGEPIGLTFSHPGTDFRITLSEKKNGVWRTLDQAGNEILSSKEAGRYSTSLPTDHIRSYMAYITVEALADGKVTARGKAEVIVTPAPVWDDYETFTWLGEGLPFLFEYEAALMRDFGLTGNSGSAGNARETKQLFRESMRVHPIGFAQGMHMRDFNRQYKEWGLTKDKKCLVRDPSFADTEFKAKEAARVTQWAQAYVPYAPLSMILADETSLTSYTAELDFDFHPQNIADFRAALRQRFGTIDALNQAVGTSLASFETIEPPTSEEARAAGNWGLWNLWREHNDITWTGAFTMYDQALKKGYPESRVSVSGTQTSAVFNGIDWARLTPVLTAVSGYGGRFQELKRLSFFPGDQKVTPWGAYGRHGRAVDHQLWESLVTGADGRALFWWYSLRDGDLSLSRSGADYGRVFKELESGMGRQYMLSTRRFTPVAVLWSATSQRAAWTKGAFDAFVKAENSVVTTLQSAGFDPFFMTEKQAAAGAIKTKGVKAMVLPMTLALGTGKKQGGIAVIPALAGLVEAGGTVIATHDAEFDEFLQPAVIPDTLKNTIVKFADIKDNIQAALESRGVKPWAAVSDPAGQPIPGLTATIHTVPGGVEGFLLTLLRPPVGTKEVVGADGVIHTEPDASGGKEIETASVTISGLGELQAYDMRTGRLMTPQSGGLSIDIQAGGGTPIALLPYTVDGISVTRTIADRTLTAAVRIRSAARSFTSHVVHVEVVDAVTGAVNPAMVTSINCGNDGTGTVVFPLALEDEGRDFIIRVRDILSGSTASTGDTVAMIGPAVTAPGALDGAAAPGRDAAGEPGISKPAPVRTPSSTAVGSKGWIFAVVAAVVAVFIIIQVGRRKRG